MTAPYFHAESSAKKFGGKPEDYIKIHEWFDETKKSFCDCRHRALRHHAEGIFWLENEFGIVIPNSKGKLIPVRYIGEQHVFEDCGRIPSIADWLNGIPLQVWMSRATTFKIENNDVEILK